MVRAGSLSVMRDLPARLATALVYGATMLGTLLFGRLVGWAVLISVVAVLALAEFYTLTRQTAKLPNEAFGIAATAAMPILAAYYGLQGLTACVTGLVVASLVWHLVFRQIRIVDTALTVFGVIYVGFTLSHLVLMRSLSSGTVLVLATVLSVWLNDVAAYLFGSVFGRHKMAPRISPNKSWEGFSAGVIGSILVWTTAYFIADTGLSLEWHLAVGAAVSFGTIIGDLVESRFKREIGVKDSGRALPGHGGFLDRFDSLILVSVVAYYAMIFGGAS